MNRVQTAKLNAIDITCLPTLPQILFRLLDACASSDRNMHEIADLVRQDAALAARVVAIAASPAYGRSPSARPLNLEQTLMLLGTNTLRTLALTAAAYQFVDRSLASHPHRHRRFWHDALLTAVLAGKIAELSGYHSVHEAYLAGLLSGIGQIGLITAEPEQYDTLLDQAGDVPETLISRETQLFGIDHATLGGLMLQRAGRRGALADAVRFHHAHTDELSEAHHLVRVVAVASRMSANDQIPPATGLVAGDRILGLIPSLLEELHTSAVDETLETAHALGLDCRSPATDDPVPPRTGAQGELEQRLGHWQIAAAVRRQLSDSERDDDLLATASLASQLLFGLGQVGYFLIDSAGQLAVGHAGGTDEWAGLMLKLPSERSLVGRTLTLGQSADHFPWQTVVSDDTTPASVLDLEILELLGTQGMSLLPLAGEGRILGAAIIGLNAIDEPRLNARRALLELFAREIGDAIASQRRQKQTAEQTLRARAEEQDLKIRSVIHEVKNPLSIIKNYLGILDRHIADGHPQTADDIRIIDEEIGRVGALLRSLSEIGHAQESRGEVDVNAVANDVITLLKPTLIDPAGIRLMTHLDTSIPVIKAAHNSVKQILVNLLKNAAEALNTGQTITLTTADYIYIGNQAYVGIDIADDGPGLPPQVLATLFQPVISTKGGHHAGLGLSITKKLVDALHGTITCRSNPTQGTRMQILLPRRLPNA
ncbi:HDOD domain-containing protein [Acidihalobacter prosperus]|uniref:histidine kinase n=1 Tax=Acidihalobacter prosperus TaxID=160660 RepID=A0A1A6C7E5_9GAMM|nr:HDOD domain-containing protein [Acidihalobacter prosperus]OBS10488.1 hypothetical protein Thpro_020204 [Acidihalobacter prosperus]